MPGAKKIKSQPLVSVVIVNWNGLEDTKLCLLHTKKQTYQNYEIVVIDNGSVDNSLDYLRGLNDIVLVENPKNMGFTGGHIAGYKASKGDFVLLLNNDAIMDNDYLKKAVDYMLKNQDVGAVGGRAYLWDEDNPLFRTTNHFYAYQNINVLNGEGIFTQHDNGIPQEVNNVSGSCVMVRRSVTDQIGYLHNPFFAYFEESDLFARMKRAGYKVIYHPDLAIWHANAKSSERKAPTFSIYMMMRNRFRFAVRNFDSWALKRFFKFYIRMGLVSTVKAVIPGEERAFAKANAKAFYYNLVFGWRAFAERRSLKKQLGPTNYNQLIYAEQNPISVIANCQTKTQLNKLADIRASMNPGYELLIVSSSKDIFNEFKRHESVNFRLCKDRGYFKTHAENLGVICAKNNLVLISEAESLQPNMDFSGTLYRLFKNGLRAAAFGRRPAGESSAILHSKCTPQILLNRSLFVEAGGLLPQLEFSDSLRAMLLYAALGGSLLTDDSVHGNRSLAPYNASLKAGELIGLLRARHEEASLNRDRPNVVTARFKDFFYFRLSQLRILVKWYSSGKITLYLKLARTKNLVLAVFTLNRKRLAVELTHIRNELIGGEYRVNLAELKEAENKRLEYLKKRAEDTITFIITRDRYESLAKLLKWLEKQKMSKVVLVDNDSTLPPLADFFDKTNYQVLELRRNAGNRSVWNEGIIKVLLPDDFYIVTDPDIVPTSNRADFVSHFYEILEKYPDHMKAGPGLKIDDLPDHYALKKEVIKWEKQFWVSPMEEGVYEAGLDTTFAVYRPHTYLYFIHPSLRTGEPYTARHLPWYDDSSKLSDEEVYYRLRLDQSVNSWNVSELPDRYKKELAKQER